MGKKIDALHDTRMPLTKERIKQIGLPPKGSRKFVTDENTAGLRVSVTPKGTKTFQFRMWNKEKQAPTTITIGSFPQVSLEQAKDRVKELTGEVVKGKDLESIRNQKRAERTCIQLFEDWYKNHGKQKKRGAEDLSTWKRLVAPQFGTKRITEVTHAQVENWHRGLTRIKKHRGKGTLGNTTANRALALLRAVYNASAHEIDNPASRVKPFKERGRERFLDGTELYRFLDAVKAERKISGDNYVDFFLLRLWTGARKSNVQAMRWDAIHENTWLVPSSEHKSDKRYPIALSDDAMKIIARRREAQRRNAIISPYVLDADNTSTGFVGDGRTVWNRIIKAAGITNLRAHDLRHTLGSQLALSGATAPEIKAALNHADIRTSMRYAHLQASQDTVNKAADRMKKIAEDSKEKVKPFKPGTQLDLFAGGEK